MHSERPCGKCPVDKTVLNKVEQVREFYLFLLFHSNKIFSFILLYALCYPMFANVSHCIMSICFYIHDFTTIKFQTKPNFA